MEIPFFDTFDVKQLEQLENTESSWNQSKIVGNEFENPC